MVEKAGIPDSPKHFWLLSSLAKNVVRFCLLEAGFWAFQDAT